MNRTWERRSEIEPDHEMRRRPGPLKVCRLLPRSKCRAFGQPTCFVFDSKLVLGQVTLDDCPVVSEPEHAEERIRLQELLPAGMPAIRRPQQR